MKTFLLLFFILITTNLIGQESFRKSYKIPVQIILEKNDTVFLMIEEIVKFSKMAPTEKDSIKSIFKIGSVLSYQIEKEVSGKKVKVNETITIDNDFQKKQSIKKNQKVKSSTLTKGYVKFDKDKIIVNPNLQLDKEDKYKTRETYYYKLKNRQTIKLKFNEWTASTLAIPIKYRFKNDDKNLVQPLT